ncbi:MAG TPA: FCD domain-containing protein [Gemmatimonadales bacterium]|nr:FCD domain-containing protein [Gemmatimonadales bacterium]
MVTLSRAPLRSLLRLELLGLLERDFPVPGTRVRDTDLAGRLGVSRTPVREALLDLVRLGLLRADHQRGFRVAPLDAAEVRELGQMLGALEALALRLAPAQPAGTVEELRTLLAALEAARGDARRVLDANEAWHERLVRECPNARLLARLAELRLGVRRYVYAYLTDAGRLGLATGGHRRVVEALGRGEREEAARRLEEQLVSGTDELGGWLERRAQAPLGAISRSIAST